MRVEIYCEKCGCKHKRRPKKSCDVENEFILS